VRTSPRDHGTIVFGIKFADAASGNGVTSNGIFYTWVRNSTGVYGFNFDSRIHPTSIAVAANSAGGHSMSAAIDTGYIQIVSLLNNAVNNFGGSFTVTAIDKRT
jgi:hypothetical protein